MNGIIKEGRYEDEVDYYETKEENEEDYGMVDGQADSMVSDVDDDWCIEKRDQKQKQTPEATGAVSYEGLRLLCW